MVLMQSWSSWGSMVATVTLLENDDLDAAIITQVGDVNQ
jgi:hypothetical protein